MLNGIVVFGINDGIQAVEFVAAHCDSPVRSTQKGICKSSVSATKHWWESIASSKSSGAPSVYPNPIQTDAPSPNPIP
jgi:hypothetical protein